MVAPAIAPDPPQRLHWPPAMERLGRAMCLSLIATMLLVAVWLSARRLAGVTLQPLGFLALLFIGAILAGLVTAIRILIASDTTTTASAWPAALQRWLPGLAMVLLATVLTLPGTSWAAATALWSWVALNEGLWIGIAIWRRGHVVRGPAVSPRPSTDSASPRAASRPVEDELPERSAEALEDGELHLPDEVSQQITRTRTGESGDALAGLLRAVFQPGERSRYLHVAICPPMAGRPEVEVVQLSGPSTRVKAAEIQSFGIRFDLRLLAASSHKETVLIHFEACCPD